MTYRLSDIGIRALRSAAEQHGAGEAELAAIERLDRFEADASDVERLAPLAKLADLPWAALFYGTQPGFKCKDCEKPMGARRLSASHPWEPQPCFWCERKRLARGAAKRRRETPDVLGGVDVVLAVAGLRQVPVFAELLGRRKVGVDVGHEAAYQDDRCGGRAWISKKRPRMRVYGGANAQPARVLEVVLHELCHLALPRGTHHGERFRRTFQRAVREAWGIEVPLEVERENHANASYKMGELVVEELRAKIAAGLVDTFPPAPAAPKPSRAERTAELVEERAAHAEKMLAKAERKLKLAKTVHARWRAKVSYYERVAARRKT